MRFRKPSPALLVALLALFVALGGTSYAALKLPKGSVGAKQLKKNSVTSPKVKPGSLLLSDFKRSQRLALRGPQGPQGLQGPQGTQGLQGPAGLPATKLWAKVSSATPSIVRNSGATGLEGPAAIGLTGVYRIAFDQNISNCLSVASISTADGGQPPAGQIGTNNSAANPNAIVVATYNAAGTAVNTQDFTVAVFC
jgi:hypothetical protein